jgi:hypothetical protein
VTDDKDRTPEEVDDAFEAIIDGPDQDPVKFHVEVSPISPLEDVDVIDGPKFRTLQEAIEAWRKQRETSDAEDEEG